MQKTEPSSTELRQMRQMPDSFYEWNETLANQLAAEEDIELSDRHWQVIHFLRKYCDTHGIDSGARSLLNAMSDQFQSEGGKKYLYTLFPRGPVVQACKISSIPLPEHARDLSFGSVH